MQNMIRIVAALNMQPSEFFKVLDKAPKAKRK